MTTDKKGDRKNFIASLAGLVYEIDFYDDHYYYFLLLLKNINNNLDFSSQHSFDKSQSFFQNNGNSNGFSFI